MVGNAKEDNIPNWPQDAIDEINRGGGEPFQCSLLNKASKLLKVSSLTIKYAYHKGKTVITRQVNGDRVFHLQWLKCRLDCN